MKKLPTKYGTLLEIVVTLLVAELLVHVLSPLIEATACGAEAVILHAALLAILAGPIVLRSAYKGFRQRATDASVMRTSVGAGFTDACIAAGCIITGLSCLFAVAKTLHSRRDDALAAFKAAEHSKTATIQVRAQDMFLATYQQIRTVARLPGVKKIDRYALNFDADAKTAVQEIYNNLAQVAPISEFYIVPVDLEPDSIDPVTLRNQEPIVTFDQLIVGKVGGEKTEAEESDNEGPELEETEIYEYRLMKSQLAYFKLRYPREVDFEGLDYPAMCGPQVITCDNSRFDPKHPDDQDRSGLVYSVPFYGPDGLIKGCISAVALTTRLQEVIADPDRALVYTAGNYAAPGKRPGSLAGMAAKFKEQLAGGSPATNQLYSESLALNVRDEGGQWSIWGAADDASFLESSSIKILERDEQLGFVISAIVSLMLAAIAWSMRGAKARAEALAQDMTADLEIAKSAAEAASRAKSAFLANMSHEIRTPLTAIMGFADLLRESGGASLSSEQRLQTIDTIRNAGTHLLTVINDILDLSKIEADKMTVERIDTPFVGVLHEVESLMRPRATDKGLSLKVDLATPVPEHVMGDPTRLRQILMNLVGNAVKFTSTGTIRIVSQVIEYPGGPRLLIDVEDSGPGMTPEQVSRLFQAFGQADDTVTRKFGGSGLGLTICRRLAALMGGSVTLTQTVPGKGSTFRLNLALEAVAGSAMVSSFAAVRVHGEKIASSALVLNGRILFAEDGADNQRLIAFHLRRAGAVVDIADNGRVALEMLAAAASAGTPYNLVLTDMQMPEMDGYTLARTLRQGGIRIPIIALTAHAMAEDRARCVGAGCSDYASKPIDKDQLLQTCARWLSRPEDQPGCCENLAA